MTMSEDVDAELQYQSLVTEITSRDMRCGCCDRLLYSCHYWQMIRLVVNPTPAEASYLDGRRTPPTAVTKTTRTPLPLPPPPPSGPPRPDPDVWLSRPQSADGCRLFHGIGCRLGCA